MTKPRRGRFARCFAQAALALALAPVYAQSPQPSAQAEVSTHEAPLTFKTKVNLVSIPVVVRDAKGRAVGNLSRDDFQITDNGKRQAISRFSIERFGEKEPAAPEAPAMQTRSATGTLVPSQPAIDSTRPRAPQLSQSQTAEPAQPPATPERFVAYVFDDVNTKANDLAQAREAAYQHMITSLRPTERAAVYTTSGQGGADFTDDRDKLRKAMRAIRPQNPITQSSDCPPMTVYQAERISKDDVEALGAAMADIQTCSIQDQATGEEEWKARNAARAVLAIADRNIITVLAGLDGIVK